MLQTYCFHFAFLTRAHVQELLAIDVAVNTSLTSHAHIQGNIGNIEESENTLLVKFRKHIMRRQFLKINIYCLQLVGDHCGCKWVGLGKGMRTTARKRYVNCFFHSIEAILSVFLVIRDIFGKNGILPETVRCLAEYKSPSVCVCYMFVRKAKRFQISLWDDSIRNLFLFFEMPFWVTVFGSLLDELNGVYIVVTLRYLCSIVYT